MLHHYLSLRRGRAVDTEARLYFLARQTAAVTGISGLLHGPHSAFARTLPTTFAIKQVPGLPGEPSLSEVVVTDPCFWSPNLPFLYDLKLTVATQAGRSLDFELAAGMKRWYLEGADWILDGKRMVLRGAESRLRLDDLLTSARVAETALVIPAADDHSLEEASRVGVPLVVDLSGAAPRDAKPEERVQHFGEQLDRLSWHPAVMAVLGDAEQLSSPPAPVHPSPVPIGLGLDAQSAQTAAPSIDSDFLAVTLHRGERPPPWLAGARKPVIAIRREEGYPDLESARSACDRLQAELSPEFDLAGYFVTL